MVADSIEREIVIEAPAERVWALITESEHVGTWFADVEAEVDPRPGGVYRLTWEKSGTTLGRVVTVEPYTRFSYRWNAYGAKWGEEPEDGCATLVEFLLEPAGTGTRLRVIETGFAALDVDDDVRTTAFDGNVRGWAAELGELQEYATRVAA